MVRKACYLGLLAALGMSLDAAAVSDQVETLLYDTHQKVTNLNKNLDGAIQKLNETTTELVSRVSESENQTKQLRSLVEENQVKLDNLEQQLSQLTATIYQQFNLTTAGAGYAPPTPGGMPSNTVAIQPPSTVEVTEEPERTSPSIDPATTAAHTVYQQAQKTWLAEDYPGALREFTDFLARYPSSDLAGNAQYWQGRCLLKLDKNDEAVSAFEKVRANFPSNDEKVSQAMQSEAVALSRLGRNSEAERLLEEVIRAYPGTIVARQAESDLAKLRGN